MTKVKEKIEKVKTPEGVILKAIKDVSPVKIKDEKVEAQKAETPKTVEAVKISADPKSMTFEEKIKINENFQDQKRAIKAEIEAKKKDNTGDPLATLPLDLSVLEAKLKLVQDDEQKWLMSVAKMLEPEIKKNGFIYRLFKRGDKALIYAQYDKRDAEDGGGISENPVAYEVFLSKISPPKIAFKKPYDAYEMFPGNGVFGIWAWSCMTAEKVEVRFANLEKGLTSIEESEDGEGDEE